MTSSWPAPTIRSVAGPAARPEAVRQPCVSPEVEKRFRAGRLVECSRGLLGDGQQGGLGVGGCFVEPNDLVLTGGQDGVDEENMVVSQHGFGCRSGHVHLRRHGVLEQTPLFEPLLSAPFSGRPATRKRRCECRSSDGEHARLTASPAQKVQRRAGREGVGSIGDETAVRIDAGANDVRRKVGRCGGRSQRDIDELDLRIVHRRLGSAAKYPESARCEIDGGNERMALQVPERSIREEAGDRVAQGLDIVAGADGLLGEADHGKRTGGKDLLTELQHRLCNVVRRNFGR